MPPSRPRRSKKAARSSGTLVATAERLADRLASKSGNQVGEEWQRLALDMYDAIPELRAAARITGQAMSQCRLVIARVTDGEPAPLQIGTLEEPGVDANHPAQKLLEHFAGGQGGQSAWLDMLGVHLTVTGESISVGAMDTAASNDHPLADWTTYSPEQVKAQNKSIIVKTGESAQDDVPVNEEESGVTAVRIWRPHPRYSWQADSAARAALGAMNEIIMYDQHIESSAISRLISAGLLFVPDGMTLPGLQAEDDSADVDVDPFMRFLMHVMSIAIKDRGSAAARVPIMVRGDKEDGAAIRHITLDSPFDQKVQELRDAAIRRLAVAVDLPSELLTGLGDTQHWIGALITQDWVNNYLQTLMSLACGSLTSGWLHKALASIEGVDDYSNLIVWFDSSAVRVRENIGPETQWAWENGLVSDDTARRVFGFDDSDKPSEEEYQKHILVHMVTKSPALAPFILPMLGFTFTPEELAQVKAITEVVGTPDHPRPAVPVTPATANDTSTLPTQPGAAQEPDTTKSSPTGGASRSGGPGAVSTPRNGSLALSSRTR